MTFQNLIEKTGYIFKNNVLLFQRNFLSNWYGAFPNQDSGFYYEVADKFDHFGHRFLCAEAAVMVEKAALFRDWESIRLILNESHPKKQQELGRQVKRFNQSQWDEEKERIYFDVIFEKFRQNKTLKEQLLSIPDFAIICEATPDLVWGCGLNIDHPDASDITKWPGQNLLGKCLMKVKEKIKRYEQGKFL